MKQTLALIFITVFMVNAVAQTKGESFDKNVSFGITLTKNPKSLRKNETKNYLSAKPFVKPDIKAVVKNKKKPAPVITDKKSLPKSKVAKKDGPHVLPKIKMDSLPEQDINLVDLDTQTVSAQKQYLLPEPEEQESTQQVYLVSADSETAELESLPVEPKSKPPVKVKEEELLPIPPQTNAPVMDPSIKLEEIASPAMATSNVILEKDASLSATQVNIAPVINNTPAPVVLAPAPISTPVLSPVSQLATEVPARTFSQREKGFRVAVLKPVLDLRVRTQRLDSFLEPKTLTNKLDSTGVSLGYAHLTEGSLGWTINTSLLQVSDGESATIGRLDGNLGVAFNKYIDIKAGINGSKFLSGNKITNLMPNLGYQASVGIKVYENFGIDIGVTEMTQMGQVENMGTVITMETQQKGMEVGLNATF